MIEIDYWAAAVAIKRPSKSESFGSFLDAKGTWADSAFFAASGRALR